jgi:arylsulfatase A-like enzyme
VHAPFQANKKLLPKYEDKEISGQAKAFATMIESMDISVGAVTAHLEKLGIAEDTLILFVGDNGTDAPLDIGKMKGRNTHGVQCAAPLRGKKATHYEGGMRVPFIATWAKLNPENRFQKELPIKAGHISSDIGTIHDIFPTVLESVGIEYSTVTDGVNLAPALSGKPLSDKPREFLMHFPHAHRSSYFTTYRLGEWKIIYHYLKPVDARYELFHLPTDQSESHNLAKKDPVNLQRMFASMQKALDQAGAQYPVEKEDNSKEIRAIAP